MLISTEICNQFSDVEIIKKTQEDVDYFTCLYQRYENRLLNYIHRISNLSSDESRDILQEAFIKVWKNLNGFNTDLKLSSWLYRIVHNEVISNWRKRHAMKSDPFSDITEQRLLNINHDFEVESFDEEKLKTGLHKLPPKYREVLILKYFEEMTYEEISDVLKIPVGTVATRINRAKKACQKYCKP